MGQKKSVNSMSLRIFYLCLEQNYPKTSFIFFPISAGESTT